MLLDRIAEISPPSLGRPLSIGSGVLALGGALLVLVATANGSWLVLVLAATAFAAAGTCWQVADRVARKDH